MTLRSSATWTQLERALWGEIRGMIPGAPVQYPKPMATALHVGANRYAIGIATNEGVRFRGFHGSVLVVLDEVPGVRPEIFEAIEGIHAGGKVRVLALGNPMPACTARGAPGRFDGTPYLLIQ